MRSSLLVALGALLYLGAPLEAAAQTASRAFSLFLDCSDFYCDPDYYRTVIAFVDHVREHSAADVLLLVTDQRTRGVGRLVTLALYDLRRFASDSVTNTRVT